MAVWDWVFCLPTWLYVIVGLILLIYLYGVWPYITSKLKFPGPRPAPFLGTVVEMFKLGAGECDAKNIKEYGDVTLTWGMRQAQLLVADPDMIKEILVKQFPTFVNRLDMTIALSKVESEQLTFLEDDHWKFVRATLTPAFSSGRLRGMVPLIENCVENLQDVIAGGVKDGKSIDVQKMYHSYSLDGISATAFGIDSCSLKNPEDPFALMLKKLLDKKLSVLTMLNLIFPFLTPVLQWLGVSSMPSVLQQTMKVISRDIKHTIEQRKQHETSRRDILQLMIDARVDNLDLSEDDLDKDVLQNKIQKQRKGLTESEIMAQSFVFFVAGYATTAGALSMMSYSLALNPECQETLIEEIDRIIKKDKPTYENVMSLTYLDMCLSETLRLYPAADRLSRVAAADIVIKGHLIPKNMSVQIPVKYLHNNPEYWPEPEKFNPDRFRPEEKDTRHPYVYLPFGMGPRNCVGMRFALLNAKMAMVSILQKYRFVRSPETEVPLKLTKFGVPEAENGVWLKVESRV